METSERLAPDWLRDPALQRLFAVLLEGGGEARAIGGAVRNTLMGEPIKDVDLGTTLLPEEVMRRADRAGFHAVPTGIAHGTVTVVVEGRPVEVTTLRRDVATYGRHAEVAFTDDWSADAHRRDLTVNALSLSPDGRVFDYVGGIEDCRRRRIRFIGDPAERMREDYLRILRFFRIHATYGRGDLDADGLAAARREKAGLRRLSAERVQHELFRLLEAPGVVPVVRTVVDAGILAEVLPPPLSAERLCRAIAAEEAVRARLEALAAGVPTPPPAEADPARLSGRGPAVRLLALTGTRTAERAEAIAGRLRLSRAATRRMADAVAAAADQPLAGAHESRVATFRLGLPAVLDGLVLAHALGRALRDLLPAVAPAVAFRLADQALPVTARLLLDRGLARPGPALGQLMRTLEARWVETDFTATREDLLELAARTVAATDTDPGA